jgi:hypothetical protein
LDTLFTKKALSLGMDVGDVKKELKVVKIVKVAKGVKA